MCEIHTVLGKYGVAEPATPPVAAAALRLGVQYVLYATCCAYSYVQYARDPKYARTAQPCLPRCGNVWPGNLVSNNPSASAAVPG
eukprot:363802-Chlamydomonas_euryale.AAC.8